MLKNYLILLLWILLSVSCSNKNSKNNQTLNREPKISMNVNLVLGEIDATNKQNVVFGKPVAIRSDSNYIYIADRSSLKIKVFDLKGNYKRSLGGRGRGPSEFYDIRLMEFTPEGNLIVLDKNNLRYTTISKQGEHVLTNPIELNNQYYFNEIEYVNGKIIGSYITSGKVNNTSEVYDRNIFHVFGEDMNTKYSSFLTSRELGVEDWFGFNTLSIYPGSMKYVKNLNLIMYSPGIYSGSLYLFDQENDTNWVLSKKFNGTPPHSKPYILYDSEAEFDKAKKYPGVTKINYAGKAGRGKLNSMNAGVFYLADRKSIIQFYAEWREGNTTLENGNYLDLSMQLYNLEGKVIEQSYLTSMKIGSRTNQALVNWMDENENFYMFDYSTGKPLVTRFSLNLP